MVRPNNATTLPTTAPSQPQLECLPSAPQLLKHLAVVRPNNANRSEYYIHAEVFAALVSIEIVPVDVSRALLWAFACAV